MSDLKTKPTGQDVEAFLGGIADDKRRQDCVAILDLMTGITGAGPKMWGTSIVGFGDYHYKYASGREGDWFLAGFSPRKDNLTIYLGQGFAAHDDVLGRLGRYKMGKGCLYIKRLEDIDLSVLRELIARSIEMMR